MDHDDRVCILGMGYVGLTLAVVMAERGFDVDGIEINPEILASIRKGKAHFYETNLDFMLRRNVARGRLRFSETIPSERDFDTYVITVGTPLDAAGQPRTDMVRRVSEEIAEHMRDDALVVLRSTVGLGTSLHVAKPALDRSSKRYCLAFCPERTIEGRALAELPVLPQVVGGLDERSRDRAGTVFGRITPTIMKVSNIQTAELIKLLDNSFRDMFFAFGNEVAVLCEKIGVDGAEVIKTANLGYERTNIAWPGFVGGPCLQKDPHILMRSLDQYQHTPHLIRSARQLNEDLVGHAFRRALDAVGRRDGLTVAIMGMAFKGEPDTDDLRGSPSLLMLEEIRRELPDARIRAQDYVVREEAIAELGVEPVDTTEVFRGANMVFIMNNNRRYSTLDFESLASEMASPGVIYDAWNVVYREVELPEGVVLRALGA
jgi:UDP-N-acetyl-D-mannosaminuronic acid dehydrogenase